MAREKSLYAVVQTLDDKEGVRETPIGFPRWTVVFPDLMESDLLGFVDTDRVLAKPHQARWPRNGKRREVPFFEFSTRAAGGNLRQYTVSLPEGCDDVEVKLSPDGRRLAWLLEVAPKGREYPGSAEAVQVAVGEIHGDVRVLGTVTLPDPPAVESTPRLLSWLPDGKRLSFEWRRSRWWMPVPDAERGVSSGSY